MKARIAGDGPGAAWICTTCRTVLEPGSQCSQGDGHEVVDLSSSGGRAVLRAALWRASRRGLFRRLTERFRRWLANDNLLTVVLPLWLLPGLVIAVGAAMQSLIVLAAAGAGLAAAFPLTRMLTSLEQRSSMPPESRPYGAPASLREPGPCVQGTIEGTNGVKAPISGEACLGFALQVQSERARQGPILLRLGWTAGFDLMLDDGRRASVPSRWVRVVADASTESRFDGSLWPTAMHLLGEAGPWFVVPGGAVLESVLRAGDRVELRGELRDEARAGAGYRDGTRVLVPAGPLSIALAARDEPLAGPSRAKG